jgi:ribosomal protein S18 acetylase RimI-like enzyme
MAYLKQQEKRRESMSSYLFRKMQLDSLNYRQKHDVRGLFKELSPGKDICLKTKQLERFHLFVAIHDKGDGEARSPIVSMVTLSPVYTAEKMFAQIHDVITTESHRGKQYGRKMGLAEELLRMIIEDARGQQYRYLELTSKPEREAANKLYQKVGFKLRAVAVDDGTNLYRFYL